MQIQDHQNLKQCDLKSLKNLAQEIRSFILESVHKQGGHVASNLGMVEITLGIAQVFDLIKMLLFLIPLTKAIRINY